MICYAMLKPNGCIDYAGISRRPPPGYVVLPPGLTPEYQLWLMHVEGEWVERPAIPDWTRTPSGITIEDCPDGVILDVRDAETGAFLGSVESAGGRLDLDLPDPGAYRIGVSVPEPWAQPDPFTVDIHP